MVVAEQTIRPEHQVPIPFELVYDPSRIDPTHRYAVQARIGEGDRLAFMNDQVWPVLTQGAPAAVEVVVRSVGGPRGGSPESPGPQREERALDRPVPTR